MDFAAARFNMIQQQIRTWDVLDQATLDLFATVHREEFMPPEFRQLALADVNIPIGQGQVTMTPGVEARMLQSLAPGRLDTVLEIGTGCAFVTALLACSAGTVHSVDIFEEFTQAARARLDRHGLGNVTLYTGDASRGWECAAPYDVIAVTGSVPVLAPDFERQLRIGGRLFVIAGEPPVMEAMLFTRIGENEWAREELFETRIPPLLNVRQPPKFSF
jgi:protein-L-isoaspartate(D-aspartate) O-methyltransferase